MMPRSFLSEGVYAAALESLVVVCVDVLVIDRQRKTAFLPQRKAKPMSGYWVIGGRVFAGEKEIDAMRRSLRRETSLDLPPERFTFLCVNRYMWTTRQQEPQNKGCDTLAYTFCAELSAEERATAARNLDPDEYEAPAGFREFDREQLVQEKIHPAIVDMYDFVFP